MSSVYLSVPVAEKYNIPLLFIRRRIRFVTMNTFGGMWFVCIHAETRSSGTGYPG